MENLDGCHSFSMTRTWNTLARAIRTIEQMTICRGRQDVFRQAGGHWFEPNTAHFENPAASGAIPSLREPYLNHAARVKSQVLVRNRGTPGR